MTYKVFIFIPLPNSIYLENNSGEIKRSEAGAKPLPDPLSSYWTKMGPLSSFNPPTTRLPLHEGLVTFNHLFGQFLRQTSRCQGDANGCYGNGLFTRLLPGGGLLKSDPPSWWSCFTWIIVRSLDRWCQGRISPLSSLYSGLLTSEVRWHILLQFVFLCAPAQSNLWLTSLANTLLFMIHS